MYRLANPLHSLIISKSSTLLPNLRQHKSISVFWNHKHNGGNSWRTFHQHTCKRESIRRPLLENNKEVVLSPVVSSPNFKFHTSQRREFNPIFWLLIKPAAKLATIFSGRSFRKWWSGLSDRQKTKFKTKIYNAKGKIMAAAGILLAVGIINFVSHIQEAPITGRKRYLAFSDEQFMKIAKYELEAQWENLKDSIVDPNDPRSHKMYRIIADVAQKIVDSNQDIELMQKQKWTVVIVADEEPNAFVLPTGQIFVFTGILKLCDNKDQLAVILGHEIAHVVLKHGAEKISIAGLLDVVVIIVMAAVWALMPNDGVAIVTQWFYNKVMNLLLHLPYSRKLEAEADEVGLQFMAKACYDIRESSTFWEKMAIADDLVGKDGVSIPEWMSTHPASANRASILEKLIPKAIEMRECRRCPRLPAADPRLQIETLKQILAQENVTESESETKEQPAGKPLESPPLRIPTSTGPVTIATAAKA